MLYKPNRRKMKRIQLLILLMFLQNMFGQELPPIQNFYPSDYNAENQNWAISQSSEKLIYVANNKGLLEFNGAAWKLYPSPNETIMRSVIAIDNRIYTGCYMEFGYWVMDDLGVLQYTSISKEMDVKMIEDEEFWHIVNIDDWIVFQSLNRIYIYNVQDGKVSTIESSTTITNVFKVNENIYFQRINNGIFKIENGKDVLVFDDEAIKDVEVINIFPSEKEELLVLTRDDGFYNSENSSLVRWETSAYDQLSNMSFYSGIRLNDNSFALGTISNGMVYLTEKGDLIYHIDQNKGISNNTVLSLFEDADDTIWLGLDNGISYLNRNSPFREYNDEKGTLGSVYASAIVDRILYIGTNQGLFYRSLEGNNTFNFIEGTQGQVWSLKEIDNTLFCGHNSGTFIIERDKATKISSIQGTWNIEKLGNISNLLIQGNYDGLYILEKSNNEWKLRNKIKGFNNSSRYFETFGNEIFVNHEYKGVFKVLVDSTFFKVENVSIDTLIKGSNSGIVKYNKELLYSYANGIFKYENPSKTFVKDSILSKVYTEDEYISGKLIVNEKSNDLWLFTDTNISFISPGALTNMPKINNIPLKKQVRKGVIGYENILRLEGIYDNTYLLGTTNGYITVNLDALKIKNFQAHIGSVIIGSNKKDNEIKNSLNKQLKGSFKSDENNLKISYYTPEFNKFLKSNYQFQLLGIYDDWSNWSENSTATFENLPFGDYTFRVRAKIGNTLSNSIATYSFTIAKPWYISNVMIAIYALGVLLFSFFMHNIYKRYYTKQRQELINKNKQELELAQLQNEKEIIRIKNEQLEADFKSKSKELAASTMSIIKKNELLTTIKDELHSIDDESSVTPVINIIDKSLKKNDDWELFQEAFNNADSEFLKKIKTLHPSLSPNDLKLCAYLRLNLSSKEIAPLLNISSRSVEIKRYRLRKKLNLLHEENLVNYILEL
jgi:AraC family chitin signaling transcriptional activator